MRTLAFRLVSVILAVWLLMVSLPGLTRAAAQTEADRARIERVVIDLTRAEQNGDLGVLYDYMLPESRYLMSRQAFVNWYREQDQPVPAGEPAIESIEMTGDVYEHTGTEYEDMAIVAYTVPVEGSDRPESRELVLWNDGVTWRWFFDPALEIPDDPTFTVDYESPYSSDIYRQLDTFWAQVFADHGAEYRSPVDLVGVRVYPLETACGVMDQEEVQGSGALYCGWDETMYYDPEFREWLIGQYGEYAWHHVIGHEWGHHIQNVIGNFTSIDPELYGGSYTIEHELQADCLAAVFTQDAYARGTIDVDAVFEAEDVTAWVGDPAGTPWDEAGAHGTSEQRVESFWLGFDDGLRGCYVNIATE